LPDWMVKSATAGLAAGMVMAMWSMIVAAVAGQGFWAPVRAITAMLFGKEHAGGGWDPASVIGGAMLHMAFSMMAGVGFAAIIGRFTTRLAVAGYVAAAMLWGLALWAINTFAVGPAMPGGELMTSAMPAWSWFVGHLMFGAGLGLLYALWRRGVTRLASQQPSA